MKAKKDISMAELTKGYEKFIEGKMTSLNGKSIFQKTIAKAAITKTQRGSK